MSEIKGNKNMLNSIISAEDELAEVEDWILANSESAEFDDMMLELLGKTEYFDPVKSSQGYSLFKSRIKEYERSRSRSRICKLLGWGEHVAAVLLLPLTVAMFYIGADSQNVEWIEANTYAGQKIEVLLPDGSSMTLGPSSKLIYPSAFNGDERKVFLIGSAYADITTNPDLPFVVSAGSLDVFVHGTEFHMSSYDMDSEIEVALVEGSVHLLNKADHRKTVMRPGDIVCYDKTTGNFIRKNFAAGYYKDIHKSGGFQFVNQTMSDIAHCLERHFGVTIHIDDPAIADERYFASFVNNENVDEILNILNAQNFMNITRNGKIITIERNK